MQYVIAIKLSLKHWDREPAHWMVPWGRSLVNPLLIFINRGKGSLKDRYYKVVKCLFLQTDNIMDKPVALILFVSW